MRALRIEQRRLRFLRDAPLPQPAAGEVRVRVLLAGICATDLELLAGYAGFEGIPGHEFVGRVEGDGEWEGRRVVASINIGCGECAVCRSLGEGHCPRREVIGLRGRDGAFAEYLALPLRNLHRVPDVLSDRQAVFAEPLAAALRILDQVEVGAETRVAVLGAGRLGLLAGKVLASRTSSVLMLGRRRASLELAREWGLETGLAAAAPEGVFDLVVEATGDPSGLARALELVRPRGTLVLKSTYQARPALDLAPLVVKEIRLIGSRCGRLQLSLDWLSRAGIDVLSMVRGEYPLEEGEEAFRQAGRAGCRKILLKP